MGYILIVEDEAAIADRLKRLLMQNMLNVIVANEYHSAIGQIDQILNSGGTIDVLVCDLNIKPVQTKKLDAVGFLVLQYVKNVSPRTHCVIYTGNDPAVVAAKCVGLGDRFFQKTSKAGQMECYRATVQEIAGYVQKYYDFKIEDEITYAGPVIMNHTKRTVVIEGEQISMEPHEFAILQKMVRKPNVFLPLKEFKEVILETKPAPMLTGEAAHLRNCMNRFIRVVGRKHIEFNSDLGYALKA